MKADIHPDYHSITVKMTDGSEFTTQIQTLQDGAIQSAEDTLAAIAAWKKANGYTD